MPVNCGSCGVGLSRSSEPSIVCNSCSKCFHLKCASIEINELSSIKTTWSCTQCKLFTVHQTLQLIEADLSAFKLNTEKSIVNISGSIKTLVNLSGAVAQNSKRIDSLEAENREFKRELVSLRKHCNQTESFIRMKNIVVSGIPEKPNEVLEDLIIKVARSIDVSLSKDNIEKATRFRPRNGKIKPILVSFTHPSYKEQMLLSYKIHKSIEGAVIGLANNITIRIGEHLTTQKQVLLQQAKKQLKNSGAYNFVWSQNGNVLIRKDAASKIIKINSFEDIERYKTNT